MEYRQVGNTGLFVSPLSLGTMTLGEADESSIFHRIGCPEETAFKILDWSLERGVNLLDCANVYGQDGMSEKLLGRYFQTSKKRNQVVLATKFRFAMGDGPHDQGAGRAHIFKAVEDSLKRLQTETIDLYQIHMQDIKTPEEETLRALNDLVRQGKVRYIGASNYAAYRFCDAQWLSKQMGLERYVSLQMQYNLICRDIEREHIPACRKHEVGILAWSPLAGGLLSGKYRKDHVPSGSRYDVRKGGASHRLSEDRVWSINQVIAKVANSLEKTCSQVALAWLLHKPQVSSVIIGARSMEQLLDNYGALDFRLPDDCLLELEEASMLNLGYPYDFIAHRQKSW